MPNQPQAPKKERRRPGKDAPVEPPRNPEGGPAFEPGEETDLPGRVWLPPLP